MDRAVLIGGRMIASPIVEAIKATNPGFAGGSPSYTKNCQRCIVAYELRRRGYAVTAKPILRKDDPLPYINSPLGWPHLYKKPLLQSCASNTGVLARQKVETLMKSFGNGSRAVVKVNWLQKFEGHLFVAENHNGIVHFADPQTGSLDVSWYFHKVDPFCVTILRIDQSEFTELAESCFE